MIEARIAAYVFVLLALLGGGGYAGWTARDWKAAADERSERRTEDLVQAARREAELGAADAIAKIEVKNVTIRQKTEREILERPVYRDCRAGGSVLALTNEAITGRPGGAGEGGVPELSPLSDDAFAAFILKLQDIATQYRKCREAALR